MEGRLEQRTWSGKWKERFVRVKDQILSIYVTEGDATPKFESSILGCSVKKLSKDKFNKSHVFRIEINSQSFNFAAENDRIRADWTSFLSDKGRRTSFVATEVRRTSLLSKSKRDSILLADKKSLLEDITLDSNRIVTSIDKITEIPVKDTAMEEFTQVAHDFLTIVRKIALGGECPVGFTVSKVDSQEICKIQTTIISLAYVFSLRIQGIYVPLQALVRKENGEQILVSTSHSMRRSGLSEHSRAKLQHLAMRAGNLEAEITSVEDKKSKLWVTDASPLIANLGKRPEEAAAAINAQLAWDSPATVDLLSARFLPPTVLEAVFGAATDDFVHSTLEAEMAASVCVTALPTLGPEADAEERAVAFINMALDPTSELRRSAAVECERRFHSFGDPPRAALFSALQRETGFEFEGTGVSQVSRRDLVATHPVMFHAFRAMCAPPDSESLLGDVINGRYRAAIERLSAQAAALQGLEGSIGSPLARRMSLLSIMYALSGDDRLASECAEAARIASVKESIWTELCDSDASIASEHLTERLGAGHPAVGLVLLAGATARNNREQFGEAKALAGKAAQCADPLIRAAAQAQLALACARMKETDECTEALMGIEIETPFSQLARAIASYNSGNYTAAKELCTQIYSELQGPQLDRIGYYAVELLGNCFDMTRDFPAARSMYRLMADTISEVESPDREDALASVGRNIARTMLKETTEGDPRKAAAAKAAARSASGDELRAALIRLATGAAGEEAAFAGAVRDT